jgi:prephenate dehydrogenase
METVAIVGVGLIGGSFALALRKAGFQGRIMGVSSPKTIEAARARGVIDEAASLEQAVSWADLVYLAQPISRILATIEELDPLLRDGALVTDAGSTKAEIVDRAGRFIQKGQFLGGHPMAGKERRGVQEADPDLFAGRTYVLTPEGPADLETPAAREFLAWIRRIGGVPVILGPAEHDRVVSLTSHLPQLASTALATTLARRLDIRRYLQVAGPGLMDTTRLAMSSYDIWRDILATNTAGIEQALDAYISELRDLRMRIGGDRLRQEFETASGFAARLRQEGEESA